MPVFKNYLLLCMLLGSCSSPETHGSGEASTPDTSYYVPEGSSTRAASEAKAKTDTVEISEMKFHPEEIHVRKGDTVIWVNNDLVSHCVTELNKTWTSSTIPAGGSWKMGVTKGDSYYCAIHLVMKGLIVLESVQPSGTQ